MTGNVNTLAKGVVFALAAVVAPFAVYVRDGLTGSEIVSLVVLAAGAGVVFFQKNTPSNPAAVAVVAVLTAVVNAVTVAWTDGVITNEEWSTIALAFLGALAAYLQGHDNAVLGEVSTAAVASTGFNDVHGSPRLDPGL